ncbi:MAG: glycosyltransferase [Thermodesulfobacteriota bacterium]
MSWDAYRPFLGQGEMRAIERLAIPLKGRSFIHVNATAVGGGVAELLHSIIPLIKELGVDVRWEVIEGNAPFYDFTKNLHNSLQGKGEPITKEMWEIYEEVNEQNARTLDLEGDCVVIHDPQPARLIDVKKGGTWIWRCHIDVSTPDPVVWYFLKDIVERYDASIFSVSSFTRKLSIPQFLIPPSIDPTTEKNMELPQEYIEEVLDRFEIPVEKGSLDRFDIPRKKPILLQVSRFDPWKDPVGVIEAYRMVKRYRDCQLILAGGTADDDPEGEVVLERVKEAASGDPDIHILLLPPSSHKEINALQRAADIVIQKSTREGFGLVVAEALWKEKPVIASAVGGIPLQVIDGVTGCLVHSIEGTAYKIRQLLHNPDWAQRMGVAGKEHIRQNFLITRHIRDYLALWVAMENREKKAIYV